MLELALPRPFAVRQDALLMPRTERSKRQASSPADDATIVERLRDGDEAAFAELIDRYGMTMLRVAQMYVSDRASRGGGRAGDLARGAQRDRPASRAARA